MSEQNYIERYWRDATPADAIKEPPMVARFRDNIDNSWSIHKLNHWDRSDDPWVNESGHGYDWCQVYDAPDPGDGWRLVDVDSETPQEGDEYYDSTACLWRKRLYPFNSNVKSFNRRRIEPPKPKYVPFTWEEREQLRGRWVWRKEYSGVTRETLIQKLESDGRELFLINGHTAKQMLDLWRFLDTGEPVGRKVTQ